jgi:hypothetical protein
MASDSTTETTRQTFSPARGGSAFVTRLAGVAAGLGCLAVIVFASQGRSRAEYARTVAGLLMVAGCASSVGALIGFLFGIPRTLSVPTDAPAGAEVPDGSSAAERRPSPVQYRVNTNLEQISDWLTKILVGVGLAELHRLPAALRGASEYFAGALGTLAASEFSAFVLALLVYFAIGGFMTGYLGTRVLLTPLFKLADKGSKPRSAVAGA